MLAASKEQLNVHCPGVVFDYLDVQFHALHELKYRTGHDSMDDPHGRLLQHDGAATKL